MPVIKSAIKKLRRDRKVRIANDVLRLNLDRALKAAKRDKTGEKVRLATSQIDRAVKNNLIHKNRAAHMKAALSKLARVSASVKKAKTVSKTITKPAEKTKKKSATRSAKAKTSKAKK